jgi:hypothetical protein
MVLYVLLLSALPVGLAAVAGAMVRVLRWAAWGG